MEGTSNSLPVVDCHGCGVCCFHMGFPAFNLPLETLVRASKGLPVETIKLGEVAKRDLRRWIDMPEKLRAKLLQVMIDYVPPKNGLDDRCVWLDTDSRLCKHHLHRPQVCRDFDIGSRGCLDWREAYRDQIMD